MTTSVPSVAIICSRQADLVDLTRKVLKKINFTEIMSVNRESDCIAELAAHQDAVLLLDWGIGEVVCINILESLQTTHPAGMRPVFLFSRSEDEDVHGVALEFGVMQVHTGSISRDVVESRVKKLLTTQTYNRDIREALNIAIDARKKADAKTEIGVLATSLAKYPKDHFLLCELAEAFLRYERFDDALKLVEPHISPSQKNPRLLNIHGRCLLKKGQFEQASTFLQQADLINPFNVARLINLGEAYLQMDNPQRAKANFDRALKLDPTSSNAKVGVGQSLLLLGDINEALVFLRQISDPSEMASVFNVAAVIAIRNRRKDDGLKLYRVACRTVGKAETFVLSKLAFNMGLAHYRNDELAHALYFFEVSKLLNAKYDRGALGFKALEKRVPVKDRIKLGKDLFAALVDDAGVVDSLAGEDIEFRKKAADYDMDF